MMQQLAFDSWMVVIGMLIGRRAVQRGTAYRMGRKVIDDITEILDKRTFTGPEDFRISATSRWEHEGHSYIMSLEQLPKADIGRNHELR